MKFTTVQIYKKLLVKLYISYIVKYNIYAVKIIVVAFGSGSF